MVSNLYMVYPDPIIQMTPKDQEDPVLMAHAISVSLLNHVLRSVSEVIIHARLNTCPVLFMLNVECREIVIDWLETVTEGEGA